MNDNDINNLPPEFNHIPEGGRNDQMNDYYTGQTPPSPDTEENKEPKEGLTFNGLNLVIGMAIFLWLSNGRDVFTDDWSFYPYLAAVVIIHELGHVIVGKSFGCFIQEMQVFFLSFVSYKPKAVEGGSSWRDIKWSLGVLPLGGVTMFKSRESVTENEAEGLESGSQGAASATSPYIEDKQAWKRLLISAAGVLFNLATFLILYIAMPYMSEECNDFFWPLISLSLILAFLNILPVYPLDGGAIVFSLYEMVTGKKPSPGFTRACGWIGFVFIILFFWVFPDWLGGILDSIFRFCFEH